MLYPTVYMQPIFDFCTHFSALFKLPKLPHDSSFKVRHVARCSSSWSLPQQYTVQLLATNSFICSGSGDNNVSGGRQRDDIKPRHKNNGNNEALFVGWQVQQVNDRINTTRQLTHPTTQMRPSPPLFLFSF